MSISVDELTKLNRAGEQDAAKNNLCFGFECSLSNLGKASAVSLNGPFAF